MPKLQQLHRLAQLRGLATFVAAAELVLITIEKVTPFDPQPDSFDAAGCVVALVALAAVTVIELLQRRVASALAADVTDLAWRRRRDGEQSARLRHRRERIEQVLADVADPAVVYQPIVELGSGQTVGFEALARFVGGGAPDTWFAEAATVGLGIDLELKAIRLALLNLAHLPGERPYLSVNCSPVTLLSEELYSLLVNERDASRIVLELTEYLRVDDYASCRTALQRLRRLGVRLAIDDLGSGYASLRHVIELRPEIIKLDRSLTNLSNPSNRSMVRTLVNLARLTGTAVLAEGIETAAALNAFQELDVDLGQGWYFGPPQPIHAMSVPTAEVDTVLRVRATSVPPESRRPPQPVTESILPWPGSRPDEQATVQLAVGATGRMA